ncbi:MAG: hypothetical protein HY083_11540 [Gammaproteobacteria bacterium]|nr:hypothetical protein [Gammaproteobacteria bacterium]
MSSVELKITLPDQLAQEATTAGLLTPEAIERLLREEVRRRAVDRLFEATDRLAAAGLPPLTDVEVEAEIQAARMARQTSRAGSR